jgi:eukaryotic-like serine/threonine-protein kinase
MTPERWQEIEKLCQQALQRKVDERSAFLDEVCGDDQDLRRQIESLLAHEDSAEDFIEVPALQMAVGSLTTPETAFVEGQTFGHYRIGKLLGSGGIGRVYKARDIRLDRSVAIKILRTRVSEHAQFRERFQREAQAIAKLKHPNICVIHDVGQQDGLDYIVMEHLEGETLEHRLEKGGLLPDVVIKVAIEITDALDSLHRQGVIHRDLKPSNIMLTKSATKLLDFGLSKLMANRDIKFSGAAHTDTTAEGTILGTLPYVAPEQIQGKEADARSDIFSLGMILHEMLSGHKAFDGKSATDVMAAILQSERISIQGFDDRKVKALDYVVGRCIADNPDDRWQNAHDLLLQLRWIAQEGGGSASRPVRSRKIVHSILLIGLLAVLLATALLAIRSRPKPSADLMRFPIYAPPNRIFLSPGNVSPDGRMVGFIADDDKGNRLIWIRRLESGDAEPLAGTEEVIPPFFWSPDSRHIGFSTPTHLKKIALPDGSVETLSEIHEIGSGTWGGGTWGSDGTILFAPAADQPLFRISAASSPPSPVTALNKDLEEVAHVWPYFLPDGKHFIYRARSAKSEKSAMYVGLLGSNERKKISNENTLAAYAPPGYLLFVREKKLLAQRFDTARLELSGDPIPLAPGLEGMGWYSVSRNGVLTVNNGSWYPTKTELVWFDRKGQRIASLGSADKLFTPAGSTDERFFDPILSPDGREIAAERHVRDLGNIWLSEAQRERFLRFTVGTTHDQTAVWSPDGRFIAFTTELSYSGWVIRRKGIEGQTETEDLATLTAESYTTDWSPDGQFVVYASFDPETRWDCWLLPLMGDRKPRPLLHTAFNERQLQFSPDGRWIAYTSDLSGRNEVYIQEFPASGAPRSISRDGGAQPRWRRDGRELFYMAPDQKLMAVAIKTSPAFEADSPNPLFQVHVDMSQGIDGIRNHYDVTGDGQRFLVNTVVEEPPSAVITVILNWTAALKQP